MTLNLTTLILVPAIIVAGVLLLRRSLRATSIHAATAGGKQCVACAAPAELFTSFICPRCGRDAREQGLWEPSGTSTSRPFWRVMILSFLMIPAGLLLLFLMAVSIPGGGTFRLERTLTPNHPRPYQSIEISASGSREKQLLREGTLTADVELSDGNMISFEVRAPSMETVVKGTDGAVVERGTLDAGLLERWLPKGPPNVNEKVVQTDAEAILTEIKEAIGVSNHVSAEYFSSTGGSSGTTYGPPIWIIPAALLGTAIIWLLATLRLLRPGNRPTAPRAPGVQKGGEA